MGGRMIISRRRVLQGGTAAGLILAVPTLPLPAIAQRREVAYQADRLELTGARPTAAPVAPHDHGGTLSPASVASLLIPAVAVDPFRMLAVSWRGGPPTGAAVRVHGRAGWGAWQPLHVDLSEAPDDVDPDERFSAPLWVDHADGIELVVPEGAGDVALHRIVETDRIVPLVRDAAAGAQTASLGAPPILPRSAWSARPYHGSPAYSARVKLAIVHHSATANRYSAAEVPGIIAGIQRFHQDGRGWNDVAYNFLVDRFGQVWEGRAGGVDRPVIGGHTYGANTGTIGICYLGTANSTDGISEVALASIGHLVRWKFNQVHAVPPNTTTRYTPASSNSASKFPAGVATTLKSVIGHSTMSHTECPGQANLRLDGTILAGVTRMGPVLGLDAHPGGGYWLTTADGQAFPRGGAPYFGSMFGLPLNQPMIGLAPTGTGKGYWMLAADGGVFSFGDARFHGSTGNIRLAKPVVGMATSSTGKGYWLVASDGGIFAFGDAAFYGSMGGVALNKPVVGMARTPSGRGYWLFASDGGIFAFGDAGFFGSAGGDRLASPAVAVGAHPRGTGYWLVLADGTVLAYNVPNLGRATASDGDPIVGIAVTSTGNGYWLASRSGTVHRFGDAT